MGLPALGSIVTSAARHARRYARICGYLGPQKTQCWAVTGSANAAQQGASACGKAHQLYQISQLGHRP